jgi:hypothetical protein
MLRRAVRDTLSAEELRIFVDVFTTAELELEVDDGDNFLLELEAVQVELVELFWIYLEVKEPQTIVARWGDLHFEAFCYDFESARERVEQKVLPAATWGEVVAPATQTLA